MIAQNDFQTHGIGATYYDRQGNPLPTFHRHNEVELNLLACGAVGYDIAGQSVRMPAQRLSVFWAGLSHRITEWQPRSQIWSFSIPLQIVLNWSLPPSFVHALLRGRMLAEADHSKFSTDLAASQRWHQDLQTQQASDEMREIVLLEWQARLRRLAASVKPPPSNQTLSGNSRRISTMLRFIAQNYTQRLTVDEIAEAAGTNPTYAMDLFRQSCGLTIRQYVNEQRIAHAQRMLITTNEKVLTVALASGFGSLSQFYAMFRRSVGQTPVEYARRNALLHAR